MTPDECITWVEAQIASFLPTEDMGQGDVSLRLPQLMTAAVSLRHGGAFGFTFPEAIRGESATRAAPLIEGALATWEAWLAERFGDEGRQFFAKAALHNGLTKPAKRSLRREPAITAAVERLRARLADTRAATAHWRAHDWLEEDQAHGYALPPAAADAGALLASFELDSEPLPPALEAFYAVADGVWTGAVARPGGEQAFDADAEHLVLMTLENHIVHHDDRDDGLLVLNQDPDYFQWTMLSREDGAIYHATKLDGDVPPKRIAASLVDYLDQLAASYGSRY